MGTKANPGEYDCYADLAENEPFFVLRGRHPLSTDFVYLWAAVYRGDYAEAAGIFGRMLVEHQQSERPYREDKAEEAGRCAVAMFAYRHGMLEAMARAEPQELEREQQKTHDGPGQWPVG